MTLEHVERRLLRQYLDLPGLSLSLAQAARLLCVDAPTCQAVLDELVNARCLAQAASGTYVREARHDDLEAWKRLVKRRLAPVAQANAVTFEGRQAQGAAPVVEVCTRG